MTKDQLEKDRAQMLTSLQRAETELAKWARAREQCMGALAVYEKQLKELAEEAPAPNRATRRRLAKVKG